MLEMIERVEAEVPLRGVGEGNNWVGEKKLTFNFVSLAPKFAGVDRRVYDFMVAKHDEFNKLNKDANRNAILVAGKTHKCLVSFCPYDSRDQSEREMGFSRPREGIEQVKVDIKLRLVDQDNRMLIEARVRVSSAEVERRRQAQG
jgi:hypothetical protein